jgi:hypothetical protein
MRICDPDEPDPEILFGVWHCLLCGMPKAVYEPPRSGLIRYRCDFCGWDENTECTRYVEEQ